MKLVINGETKDFAQEGLSVSALLALEKVEMPDMVSVQLNDEFIRQENYADAFLKDGDSINFLYFMGGGEIAKEYR